MTIKGLYNAYLYVSYSEKIVTLAVGVNPLLKVNE